LRACLSFRVAAILALLATASSVFSSQAGHGPAGNQPPPLLSGFSRTNDPTHQMFDEPWFTAHLGHVPVVFQCETRLDITSYQPADFLTPAPRHTSPAQPGMSKPLLVIPSSYDLCSRTGLVQKSAFCLRVRGKNYTGYHEARYVSFAPYPIELVWRMRSDTRNKPDQPAKRTAQALPWSRVTCPSHRDGAISAEQRGTLRVTRCHDYRGAAC
jgi:hypothetical protein